MKTTQAEREIVRHALKVRNEDQAVIVDLIDDLNEALKDTAAAQVEVNRLNRLNDAISSRNTRECIERDQALRDLYTAYNELTDAKRVVAAQRNSLDELSALKNAIFEKFPAPQGMSAIDRINLIALDKETVDSARAQRNIARDALQAAYEERDAYKAEIVKLKERHKTLSFDGTIDGAMRLSNLFTHDMALPSNTHGELLLARAIQAMAVALGVAEYACGGVVEKPKSEPIASDLDVDPYGGPEDSKLARAFIRGANWKVPAAQQPCFLGIAPDGKMCVLCAKHMRWHYGGTEYRCQEGHMKAWQERARQAENKIKNVMALAPTKFSFTRGVDFPCEECNAMEGNTPDNGWYRYQACGYPSK